MITTKTREDDWRRNTFYWLLTSVAIATIIVYAIIFSSLSGLIIGFEAKTIEEISSLLGIYSLRAAEDSVIVYRPGLHILTIVLTSECIGIYAPIVYAMLVVFTPHVPLASKARGLIVGGGILFLANIVRIMVAVTVGVYSGLEAFRVFHDVIGGGLMLGLSTLLWIDWIYNELWRRLRWPV